MNKTDFYKPHRESILAIIFSISLSIKKLFTIFWPLLIAYVVKGDILKFISTTSFYIGFIFLFILLTIHGILSWKYFYFYIRGGEFIVEKGYLKKSIIAIPIEKIISINTNQKMLHRVLGVVSLIIDSAGTKKQEVKINAVKQSYAILLKKALTNNSKDYTSLEYLPDDKPRELIALNVLDLLKIGVSRNHLKAIALIFAFYFQIQNQVQNFFKEEVDTAILTTLDYLRHSDILILSIVVISILFISFLFSIIHTFFIYFDLKLLHTHNSFLLKWGLLKHKTITMPFSRIQSVVQSANLIERIFSISTVQIIQANSKEIVKESEKVMIRGCNSSHIKTIRESFISPKLWINFETINPHKSLLIRKLIIGNLFIIPLSIFIYLYHSWWSICLFFIFEIFILWNATLTYNRRKYLINNEILLLLTGSFSHKITTISHHKVQTVCLKQSIFQQWRNIANLRLSLAGTTVNIRYIPYEKAIEIRNYILHEINKYNRNWM